MSRVLVFRVTLAVALVWTLSLVGEFAPQALARVPVFRVRNHEFHGLRFLRPQTVLNAAGIGPDASVWDDPSAWEERLERHPLIRDARVERRFLSTLVVRVEERAPVGLVPTPALEPVDADGRILPLDPSRFPLDYPILRVAGITHGDEEPVPDSRLRALAAAAVVMRGEAEFWSLVSEIGEGAQGGVVARRGNPEVLFLFPARVEARRIREGLAALEDAVARGEGRIPRSVDLRFDDYVFLDWGREGRP